MRDSSSDLFLFPFAYHRSSTFSLSSTDSKYMFLAWQITLVSLSLTFSLLFSLQTATLKGFSSSLSLFISHIRSTICHVVKFTLNAVLLLCLHGQSSHIRLLSSLACWLSLPSSLERNRTDDTCESKFYKKIYIPPVWRNFQASVITNETFHLR